MGRTFGDEWDGDFDDGLLGLMQDDGEGVCLVMVGLWGEVGQWAGSSPSEGEGKATQAQLVDIKEAQLALLSITIIINKKLCLLFYSYLGNQAQN